MPAANDAVAVPHVPATLDQVVAQLTELKALLADRDTPKPLLIDQTDVPAFLGVSRSCWYRWRSEGITPKPVAADGAGGEVQEIGIGTIRRTDANCLSK